MARCGEGHKFNSTVGTFRFLNELVKLVSPKYLALRTDAQVKTKIMDLLLLWTMQYPKEGKIKDAYDMLRRQGVVHEAPLPIRKKPASTVSPSSSNRTTSQDPTTLKIKQITLSNNPAPGDVHAANLLIQNFYEIEKKKMLRVQEIRKGRENVAVLDSMIDQFSFKESTADDLSLMRELFLFCKSLQPTILLLTEDPQQEEQIMQDALETNDLLVQVMARYDTLLNVQHNHTEEHEDDVLIDVQGPEAEGHAEGFVLSSDLGTLEDVFGSIPSAEESHGKPSESESILKPLNCVGGSEAKSMTTQQKPGMVEMDSIITEMLRTSTLGSSKQPQIEEEPKKREPLHDFSGITVDLDSMEPATHLLPRTILSEPNGLTVVLNFTKERPRDNISVIVVTVANQSPHPVSEIEVSLVPEHVACQTMCIDSDAERKKRALAGVKRFSSAFDDLALIILVSNPGQVNIPLWNFAIKYRTAGVEREQRFSVSDLEY